MSSALRLLADSSTPTPVLELPLAAPYTGAGNRRFMPRAQAGFYVSLGGDALVGVDISFGGCMCVAETPLWPGNTVATIIYLDGASEPIETQGTIMELVPHGANIAMRVRFDGLSNARRKQIAIWMANRSSVVVR